MKREFETTTAIPEQHCEIVNKNYFNLRQKFERV
jgi:hypothetical protein